MTKSELKYRKPELFHVCRWCNTTLEYHTFQQIAHCVTMFKRAEKRKRIGSNCKRSGCGHPRKDHTGHVFGTRDRIVQENICCHYKWNKEEEMDDTCSCGGYI